MARMIAATLATLLLLQIGGRSASQPKTAESGSIEGVVLRSESGEPLAGAKIELSQPFGDDSLDDSLYDSFDFWDSPQSRPIVITGADGKFLIKDLKPGRYRIRATRNGYASQVYGQKVESAPGRIIDVAAEETVKNIDFRLVQGGVITGRVRDANGQPLARGAVDLMRVFYDEHDRKTLLAVGHAGTDDRGEYRLFWIEPGQYYLRVKPESRFSFLYGNAVVDPTLPLATYYPGTVDSAKASFLDVQPGSELSADIVLPKSQGNFIRGKIVDSVTGKPPEAINMHLLLDAGLDREQRSWGSSQADYNAQTGAFFIRNVVPGKYWLSVSAQTEGDDSIPTDRLGEVRTRSDLLAVAYASPHGVRASVLIDMPLMDLNDVSVTLIRGISIPVQLRLEARDLSLKDLANKSISLNNGGTAGSDIRLNAQGTGRLDGVVPGEYQVEVEIPKSMDLYIKEIFYGRDNVRDGPLRITDQPADTLTILLSDRGGRVEGTLRDAAGQPLSGMEVVLIPDLRERKNLFKATNTDRDGNFAFRSVPPGGYKLFSWESAPRRAYRDTDVLAKYEAAGRGVQVQEAAKATVDIRIIPAGRQLP
jgi:protocatechuate 3,4-dioxygenase beta subunit